MLPYGRLARSKLVESFPPARGLGIRTRMLFELAITGQCIEHFRLQVIR